MCHNRLAGEQRATRRAETGAPAIREPTDSSKLPGPSLHGFPAPLAARYRSLQLIKADSGVRTYLGGDPDGGGQVVVKVAELSAFGSASALRLGHEAAVLRSLNGQDGRPFLLDNGADGAYIWLVQRHQPGQSLEERLADGPIDVDETLTVARSVLAQLVVAHGQAIVHRDIKPANIVVDGHPVKQAVLIDFGLSRSRQLDPALRDVAVGTARYCSPEQAGLIEAPTDERSDLYSLGLTLHECVTGIPMFDGQSFGEVLRQHLGPRSAPGELDGTLPRSLLAVIGRLVQIDPGRRYQEAEAALADVEEILVGRANGIPDPPVIIGRHDRRSTLTEPDFVGRQAECTALEAELGAARRGHGGAVSLEGESGSGKSRLLEELIRKATAAGMLVLRGHGEYRTASRPFQIFERIAADLAATAETDPALASRLRGEITARGEALAVAAPGLARMMPEAIRPEAPVLPEQHGQARAVEALAAVLDAAGSEQRPALVVLDDCQWAETLTARVVGHWAAGQRSRWAMVVVAFRSDEVPLTSPLRSIDTSRSLAIGALSESHIRDLVESMAGTVPEQAVEAVIRAAGGNAFMAQAALRGMIETGTLARAERGWRVNDRASVEIQTSRRAALLLVERLQALSPAARRLLAATAVVGRSADIELAVALSGLSPAEAVPAIDEGRRRRILWLDEPSDRLYFAHDMLREAVLGEIPEADRYDLHLRAANHFLTDPENAPYQIAYHLDMAGRSTEAFPYAMRAAESARLRHALEDAESYYLIARKGAPDGRSRYLVADGLGEVASLSGRYPEAERYLKEAAALAVDPVDEAAELGKLGEVAFRRGDQVTAAEQLETAVRRLGGSIPRRTVVLVLALVWEAAVQTWHTLTANRFIRRAQPDKRHQLRLRFYSRLAYVYWFRHGRLRCLWVHLKEMNLAERFGPSAVLAQAYSEHAPVMTTIPLYARGIGYAGRSLEMRRELGDTWGEGQSLNFYGVALYAASRFEEATEAFEEAIRILSLTGDRWEMHTALWNLALTHYRRGEWDRAAAVASETYQSAERIGDQTSAAIALSIMARASGGSAPDDAEIELASSWHNEDQHAASEIRLARALRLLHQDRSAEAAAVLGSGWAEVRRAGLRQEYVAPVLPWWVTAQRRHLEGLPAGDRSARRLARTARRTARRAVRLSRSYRNNLPHALREQGLLEARRGRLRRARRLLERSVRVAAAQGAAWEEAASLLQLGRIGAVLGWPGSAADCDRGERDIAHIERGGRSLDRSVEPQTTLSLADRFSTILDTGRQIASSSTTAAVFRAVEQAVGDLLRSDRCLVLEVDRAGQPVVGEGGALRPEEVSMSAVRRAVESRAVVIRSGSAEAGPGVSDSMVLAGIRSLVCAPILRDDRVVACFYATHRDVPGLFGPEEERLATYIATLAGATLEHVVGSRTYFRTLIENAHDITVITGGDGRIGYVSPAVEVVLGRRSAEVEGLAPADLVHPEDAGELAALWSAALTRPGDPFRTEIRFLHAEGGCRWIAVSVTNRLDDPAVHGVVLNLRDTTDRLHAEREAARAAEQFRLAFDHAPVGMALVDQTDQSTSLVRIANDAMAAMLGRRLDELIGVPITDFIHPVDRPLARAAARAFAEGRSDVSAGEVRLLHADGHVIWSRFHAALIRDANGNPDYFIAQLLDVSDQRAAEEKLLHQALHDPLTGLPNRRLLLDRLQQAIARSRRRGNYVAVLFLDLDRFKVINDSFGHATGDQVLIEVARRLRELTRNSDTLARLGGDEFVVLVEDMADPEEAPAVARRIEDALSHPMAVQPDVTVSVTTSIGITVARAGDDPAGLLRDADTALYRAKEQGRARHEVFGDHLRRRALRRMRTERELRAAVADERLVLYYEPIVDLSSGRAVGAEALVHFRTESGQLVRPADFSEVAEETGLVVPVGAWALDAACRQLAAWQAATGDDDLRLNVNVSPAQLLTAGFADRVHHVLVSSGVKPSALAFEVNEIALSDAAHSGRDTLERLRDMGCSVGIDEFGTGHSSLAYLRRMPVNFLKIDHSFVHGLGVDSEDETIVGAVIRLADALSLTTLASGVETAEQENRLRRLGCGQVQGTRYGRAGRPDDVLLPR